MSKNTAQSDGPCEKRIPSPISPEAQYQECYGYFLQVLRLIWQIPAVAVVVDGALLVSTFALVNHWLVREFVLAIAFVLTFALTFAIYKFRYFARIGQETLTQMERKRADKTVQRTSNPVCDIDYWYRSDANLVQKLSADIIFGNYPLSFRRGMV